MTREEFLKAVSDEMATDAILEASFTDEELLLIDSTLKVAAEFVRDWPANNYGRPPFDIEWARPVPMAEEISVALESLRPPTPGGQK